MRKPIYIKSRKSWFLRVDNGNGGLKQIKLGKTKKEAYDKWRRLTASGSDDEGSITALRVVLLHLEHLNNRVELGRMDAKSVASKISRIGHFCRWLAEHHPAITAHALKPHIVTTWLDSRDRWGATTRHDAVADLKQAFKWGVSEGHTERNPIAGMKEERGPGREFVIDRELHRKLFEETGSSKYNGRAVRSFRVVLTALWLSGCRPSEIRRVRVEDFDGKHWTIKKHKTRKKTKKPRKVFLCPCLQTLSKIAAAGRESGPLFQPRKGERWNYEDTRKRFDRLRKRTKTDAKCVMYSYRHSWITRAMLAGLDVATVASLAGTSIRMIDQHYGHLSQHESHLEAAAVRVAKKSAGG
ncbi:MAG: site-specific integrase [Planctomycetota bacterium]